MYLKRNSDCEVLSLYCKDYTKQLYLREISRLAQLPLKNTQNSVNALEKRGILKSCCKGKNKYFSLNLANIQTKLCLLQSEIYKTLLFVEHYPELKVFLKELPDATIIAFGSFAKFTAEKDSDLDLFVVSETVEKLPSYLVPYKIHEIKMSKRTFIKAMKEQVTLIKEIEENHVILNNHSFYVNLMWAQYGK